MHSLLVDLMLEHPCAVCIQRHHQTHNIIGVIEYLGLLSGAFDQPCSLLKHFLGI